MSARKVFRISGSDARDFLQNLVTNDVDRLADGLVYAALLTPQGKYLADFFLVAEGDAILLDVAEGLAEGLAQRLSMYKLRADVAIDATDLQVAQGFGVPPKGAYPDPRAPSLGWRAYGAEAICPEDWEAVRIAAEVPESALDLIPNESFPLEMGFERLNGVDFRKGCYVGQEVTARMKHKTELRKGLRLVEVEGDAPVGADILNGSGKVAGRLGSQAGGKGLAHLRFDRIDDEMTVEGVPLRVV